MVILTKSNRRHWQKQKIEGRERFKGVAVRVKIEHIQDREQNAEKNKCATQRI